MQNDASDRPIDIERVDWWLATVCRYGYVNELVDGPHTDRAGVEQALHLIRGMGLERDRDFRCVRVEQTAVELKTHHTNEVALSDCRMMVDRASSQSQAF